MGAGLRVGRLADPAPSAYSLAVIAAAIGTRLSASQYGCWFYLAILPPEVPKSPDALPPGLWAVYRALEMRQVRAGG